MTRGYGWQLILISDFAVLGDSWQPKNRTERGGQEGVVGVGYAGLEGQERQRPKATMKQSPEEAKDPQMAPKTRRA